MLLIRRYQKTKTKTLQIWCDDLEQWIWVCPFAPFIDLYTLDVPIDSTTSDALWAMLTSAERSKFITALNNPNGELAQQLLASESLGKEIQDPWWAARYSKDDNQIKKEFSPPRHDAKPRMMEVPLSMINPKPASHPLVYNICAILYMGSFISPSILY